MHPSPPAAPALYAVGDFTANATEALIRSAVIVVAAVVGTLVAKAIWGIQDLGDDAVTIRLVARTKPGLQWGVARVLRLRIKEALEARGMEIPFPQRTVWIRTEPETLAAAIPVAQVEAADGHGR